MFFHLSAAKPLLWDIQEWSQLWASDLSYLFGLALPVYLLLPWRQTGAVQGKSVSVDRIAEQWSAWLCFTPDGCCVKVTDSFPYGGGEMASVSTLLLSCGILAFSLLQSWQRAAKWGVSSLLCFLRCAALHAAVLCLGKGAESLN